ncbi:hypothetical protein BDY19DRAFT_910632 [Irpex rosettiformis]|uniref:Uncharacterized protein n=1 Tax=Irpex rosettiformis TaxID=378272 RepID=A0ACB8TN23_9APHY|nr:hypothetical protein BDY19DRAFT_910632 [Irpex rosettiformis]
MIVTSDRNSKDKVNTHSQTLDQPSDITIKKESSEIILSLQRKRKRVPEHHLDEDEDDNQAPDEAPVDTADPRASEVIDQVQAAQASLERPQYRKYVDEDMRELCITENCRREVTMRAFNSPPPMLEMTVPCCDNCLLSKGDNRDNPLTLSEFDETLTAIIGLLDDRLVKKPPTRASQLPQASSVKKRVKGRLNNVKEALENLRSKFWKENYGDTMLTMTTILPDSILSTLASESKIVTMADLDLKWDLPY